MFTENFKKKYSDLAEQIKKQDMTNREIQDIYGISNPTITKIRKYFGVYSSKRHFHVKFPVKEASSELKKKMEEENIILMKRQERTNNILNLLDKNHTLQEIADIYGVSRERIRQIAETAGRKPRNQERREKFQEYLNLFSSGDYTKRQAAKMIGGKSASHHVSKLAAAGAVFKSDLKRDNPKIVALAERVKNGESIWGVSSNKSEAALVREYCRVHNIVSRHGRWNDRTPRKNMIKDLRSKNVPWEEIAKKVSKLEGKKISVPGIYQWVTAHMSPEEANMRSRKKN